MVPRGAPPRTHFIYHFYFSFTFPRKIFARRRDRRSIVLHFRRFRSTVYRTSGMGAAGRDRPWGRRATELKLVIQSKARRMHRPADECFASSSRRASISRCRRARRCSATATGSGGFATKRPRRSRRGARNSGDRRETRTQHDEEEVKM